jgi:hypothetical protein
MENILSSGTHAPTAKAPALPEEKSSGLKIGLLHGFVFVAPLLLGYVGTAMAALILGIAVCRRDEPTLLEVVIEFIAVAVLAGIGSALGYAIFGWPAHHSLILTAIALVAYVIGCVLWTNWGEKAQASIEAWAAKGQGRKE